MLCVAVMNQVSMLKHHILLKVQESSCDTEYIFQPTEDGATLLLFPTSKIWCEVYL